MPRSALPLIDILSSWCLNRSMTAPREELLAAILCGDIEIQQERCRDPQKRFPVTAEITLRETCPLAQGLGKAAALSTLAAIPGLPYVSRGGEKLASVFDAWNVPVAGRVWLDAGCSTGGFSHCLLLRGAACIHAIDVGYNVLDWRLRNLEQIIIHERTNIMALNTLNPIPEAAVADLSFRSIEGAARKILQLCSGNQLYALIKPQFERKYLKNIEKETIFNGIVANEEIELILKDLARRLALEGIRVQRIMKAGVKGRAGNQEFIAELCFRPFHNEKDQSLLLEWNIQTVLGEIAAF